MPGQAGNDAGGDPPRAYRDRRPRLALEASEVLRLFDVLGKRDVTAWIDGGWGVDALLGDQTREHDDLDLVVERVNAAALTEALTTDRYEVLLGGPPKSFLLIDDRGRQVDVHPVADEEGGGVYRMDDDHDWIYPAEGFTGRGQVRVRPVRCLSVAVQVLVHDGYELADEDYRELRLLHERFGVPLPARVREHALASADRDGWAS